MPKKYPIKIKNIENKKNMKEVFEKSIVSVVDIPKGVIITKEMIGLKKPGAGIPVNQLEKVLGKISIKTIRKDTLIKLNDINDL